MKCLCCSTSFEPARGWQTFCSAKCRSAYRTVSLSRSEAQAAIAAAEKGDAKRVREILTKRMKGDVDQG